MIDRHECITIARDTCGVVYDDECTMHFPDLDAARDEAEKVGWIVTRERILCAGDAAKEACALTGHLWEAWEPLELPRHQAPTYQGLRRYCGTCATREYDPPLDTRQSGTPRERSGE